MTECTIISVEWGGEKPGDLGCRRLVRQVDQFERLKRSPLIPCGPCQLAWQVKIGPAEAAFFTCRVSRPRPRRLYLTTNGDDSGLAKDSSERSTSRSGQYR